MNEILQVMANVHGCQQHDYGHDDRRCSCRFEYKYKNKPFLVDWTDKAVGELSTVLSFKEGGYSIAQVDAAIERWQAFD